MAGGYDVERKRKERKTLGKNGTVKEASYIAELQRRLVEFAFHVPSSWITHGWSGIKAARKSIPEFLAAADATVLRPSFPEIEDIESLANQNKPICEAYATHWVARRLRLPAEIVVEVRRGRGMLLFGGPRYGALQHPSQAKYCTPPDR
jgi:hypothetical protein